MLDTAAMQSWMTQVRDATQAVLPEGGDLAWLLRQSIHTHAQRLTVLPILSMTPKPFRVLDVGAGTGAMSLDLAWMLKKQAHVVAVDSDARCIALLQQLSSKLGYDVDGRLGDAYHLPVETASQDLTVSRLVLQHLDRPEDALKEMIRVTAPGGMIAVLDVDDDAKLSESEEPPALAKLNDAIDRLQAASGGNRRIGRHLYRLFRDAGLSHIQVLAMPRIRLGTCYGLDPELEEHHKGLYLSRRNEMIAEGFITSSEFDDGMQALAEASRRDAFGFASEFLAMGRVSQGISSSPPPHG